MAVRPGGADGGRAERVTGDGQVWYAAYGSNLDPDRFGCYFHGGRPRGATRTYPGVRHRTPEPVRRPLVLPGRIVFAWHSSTWAGGIAFYEPGPGRVLACGYLLTLSQFSDVLEQEMWRPPGVDHDFTALLTTGSQTVGPGRYETLRVVAEVDGRPVVTIGNEDAAILGVEPPSAAYVATMAAGLRLHRLTDHAIAGYLLGCDGVRPAWTTETLLKALERAKRPDPEGVGATSRL